MLEILKQKKNIIIIISIIIIGIVYYIYNLSTGYDQNNTEFNMLEVAENTNEEVIEDEDIIIVHITGAVKNPGIVKLQENSRIEDAIESAGGLTEDSDISDVNLAYALEDGVKIRIPSIDDKSTNDKQENYISEDSGNNVILPNDQGEKLNSLININKANESELETLPGIGPSLASKIIEYRTDKGKFSKIEDIKNVTGIGDSKFANIKDLISVK